MNRPRILVTNDDGIHAAGIRAAVKALQHVGDVYVCAPHANRSAQGTSLTLWDAIHTEEVQVPGATHAWSTEGTPVDCVKLGMSYFMSERPDLVVSGINEGENFGRNILHSGTAAAAWTASHRDVPAIAISSVGRTQEDVEASAQWLPQIAQFVLDNRLPHGTFLNVNIPHHCAERGIKGIRLTRQGMMMWAESPHEEEGKLRIGGELMEFDEHHDSDLVWLERGYATAAPIASLDLTDHTYLQEHQHAFEKLSVAGSAGKQTVSV